MVFNGPGLYEIVPYQAPSLNMNSLGGGPKPGEKIGTWDRKPLTDNARWYAALVEGSVGSDDAVYVFVNIRNGGYLAASSKTGDSLTSADSRPSDPLVRWKVKYSPRNGYQVYLINGVNGKGQANVQGSSTKSGTPILYWQIEDGDNSCWYFDAV